MKKRTIIAALALATMWTWTPAFAYSNVSPKPAPQKLTSIQQSMHSFAEGREIAAPPWSFACINDHGPQQCDQPMWVYGSSADVSRYKSAF